MSDPFVFWYVGAGEGDWHYAEEVAFVRRTQMAPIWSRMGFVLGIDFAGVHEADDITRPTRFWS